MSRVGKKPGRAEPANFYCGPGRVGSADSEISTGRAGPGNGHGSTRVTTGQNFGKVLENFSEIFEKFSRKSILGQIRWNFR